MDNDEGVTEQLRAILRQMAADKQYDVDPAELLKFFDYKINNMENYVSSWSYQRFKLNARISALHSKALKNLGFY